MKWPEYRLSHLTERFISGSTPSTKIEEYWQGDIPWITGADFLDGEVAIGRRYINKSAVNNSATNIVPKGSILMVSRTGVGKIAIAPADVAISQDITGIVPKSGLSAKYVLSAIRDKMAIILAAQRGATIKGVTRKDIEILPIPLAPPSEQRRIVEILDQADALRKKRAEADAIAARILPALFYKMFGDPATNPKGLVKKRLGDLIKVRSGNFLPAKNMDSSGHCPVYGGNGINGYHSEYMFEEPVIVLGRVGIYCGVVHYSEPNCWVTDNALYVAEQSKDLHPRYLAEALRIANLNQYAGRAGQPLISGNRIYPIEILVPPPEEQEKFAGMILELSKYESRRESSGVHLETLFSVLMHRAFTGDLTAKWRGAHMKELLQEMEQQAKALEIDDGRLSIEKELKSSIIDHQSEIIHD